MHVTPELASSIVALLIALMTYFAARITALTPKAEAPKTEAAEVKAARDENNGYLAQIAASLEKIADDFREIRIRYGERKD
jgi:hypothetical protein